MVWLWDSLFLVWRLFVILAIINVVGFAFAAVYAWWNQAEPAAAWAAAFWTVLVAGAA